MDLKKRKKKPKRQIINGKVYCDKCKKMVRIAEFWKRRRHLKRDQQLPNGTTNIQQHCKTCTQAEVRRAWYLKAGTRSGITWLIKEVEKTRLRLRFQEAALEVMMDRNYRPRRETL